MQGGAPVSDSLRLVGANEFVHFTMVFAGDISVINGIVSQLQMNKSHFIMVSRWYTIWLFNIAMENHHV